MDGPLLHCLPRQQCLGIPLLIAGTPLEPLYHNVGRKVGRDGLRSEWIGQSAAKPRTQGNVQRLRPYQPVGPSGPKWRASLWEEDIVWSSVKAEAAGKAASQE